MLLSDDITTKPLKFKLIFIAHECYYFSLIKDIHINMNEICNHNLGKYVKWGSIVPPYV